MWTFTCPVCPLCSVIIVLYSDHREPNWNQEHNGACSLSLMWQCTLKCCLNEYNYDNTSLSNVSLAALTPPHMLLYTGPSPLCVQDVRIHLCASVWLLLLLFYTAQGIFISRVPSTLLCRCCIIKKW